MRVSLKKQPPKSLLINYLSLILIIQMSSSMMQGQFTQQQKQNIRIQQQKIRQNVNMSHQYIQQFTFQSKGQQTFQIQVLQNQIFKGEVYVYWQNQKVYIPSDVKPGQHIVLGVYQGNKMIQSKIFYTLTAFQFQAQKQKKYIIKISTLGGSIAKLFAISVNKKIPANSSNQVKNDITQNYSQKAQRNLIGFQNLIRRVTNNKFLDSNIQIYFTVLNQRYYYYQFIELIIVIIASITQVFIIKKLLKNNTGIV